MFDRRPHENRDALFEPQWTTCVGLEQGKLTDIREPNHEHDYVGRAPHMEP